MQKLGTGIIVPAKRIGDVIIGMEYHDVKQMFSDNIRYVRWGNEGNVKLIGDDFVIWIDGRTNRVEQIMVTEGFAGYVEGSSGIHIGATLQTAIAAGYTVCENEDEDTFSLIEIQGLAFELDDSPLNEAEYAPLSLPIKSITVF